MLGLAVGDRAPQAGQQHRLGTGYRHAMLTAIRTIGWLIRVLLSASNQFSFRQLSSKFIANLARQLFEVHQRASSR
jgi:hypothetical protein